MEPPSDKGSDKNSAIRVLVVDDHALVRRGIKSLLSEQGIEVVGEAHDVQSAFRAARDLHPHVVILDMMLGDERGVDLLPRLKMLREPPAVIVMTSFLNPTLVHECLSNGVAGYLVKDTENLDLASAIRMVEKGGTVFDPRVFGMEREQAHVAETVTPREYQILDGVCQGCTNAEIADRLGISESAVKAYVSSIMRKLGCDNRVKIVIKAHELGFV